MIRPALWLAFVFALLFPRLAKAQDETTLLRHGAQLRADGHDDQAVVEFQRAYDIAHSPHAAAQLGLAEQALGRWVDAERHLREARASSADVWVGRHRDEIESAYAVNEQHVGRLEVRGSPAGAHVFVNGYEVGTLPISDPVVLVAGPARIEVRANGYATQVHDVAIGAGATDREAFELAAAPAQVESSPAGPRASAHPPPRPINVPAILLAGAGVAVAAVGIGIGFGPVHDNSMEGHGSDSTAFYGWVAVEYVCFALGAAVVGTGAYLQFARHGSGGEHGVELRMRPMIGATTAGLELAGSM